VMTKKVVDTLCVFLSPTGKQGTFGGYQSWANRAGRYRSLVTVKLILNHFQ
jgi:hypothetical protein